MSNTFRKDRSDKVFKESLKKKSSTSRYRCRCERCVGKHDIIDKIAEKEMTEEIRIIETGENIDFDIPEQEEIMGR
jgi:hypothetical protein